MIKENAILDESPEYSGEQQNRPTISTRNLWLLLAFYGFAFFVFALIAPGLPAFFRVPSFDGSLASLILPLLTAWIGASIAIGIVFLGSRMRDAVTISNRDLSLFLGGGMLIDLVFNFAAARLSSGHSPSTPAAIGLTDVANLGMLATAIALGQLVARGLKKPNFLILAAIVGALTDIYSVYFGPSKQVLDNPQIFPYVSFQWGVSGQGVIPCVGAGDFIFLALFFIGVRRFQLDDRKTLIAMIAAFGLGYLSLVLSPKGIPALPFMSFLLLLVHGRDLWKLQTTPEYS